MYNDSVNVSNKIISYDDLMEIFSKMQEKLIYWKKVNSNEEIQNKMLDYKYQNWTFKDNGSKLQFDVNFYDDTSIKFDNFNSFISVFNNRLDEIKYIYLCFSLNYSVEQEGQNNQWYSQYINISIYETKMNIDISLSSEDKKLDEIYELIKNKIQNAPQKYDEVIKKKNVIMNIVSLANGLIPALVICTLLILVPTIRNIFSISYVLYPISTLLLAFVIGSIISSSKLDGLYENIIPEKKYAGYDTTNYNSIYKDDIDKYVSTSEILIGNNTKNLECRKSIINCFNKYKKYIPYEIGILFVISIIVIFLKGI